MKPDLKNTCGLCKIRNSSLFKDVLQEHLCQVNSDRMDVFHKKGQTLFHEGSQPLGLYCVNDGLVKVYKTTSNGKAQILRLAKAGDFLGYRALLSDERYAASATVLEDATICFIPKDSFFHLLSLDNRLYQRLLKQVSHELGVMEEKLADLSSKSVRERLAQTLLMLNKTYGIHDQDKETGDSSIIDIALSREDLANIVGTATETLIRLLSEFKSDGYISFKGKKINILKPKALAKAADFYS